MTWIKDDDFLDNHLGDIPLLPVLSHYSYLDASYTLNLRKDTSNITHSLVDEIKISPRYKTNPTEQHQPQPKMLLNMDTSQLPQSVQNPAKYYSKNACKNIVKKSLRAIQQSTYEEQLRLFCSSEGKRYQEFHQQILNYLEKISGPSALRRLLKNKDIGEIFRKYLLWYLKERYIREAIRAGHMKDLKVYIEYKNKELVRILKE